MGKGLPKKYAKMGFKKGWREYKKTLKSGVKSGVKKAKTGGKRYMKRPGKKVITNQYLRGAAIDLLGDVAGSKVGIDNRLIKAGMGMYTGDKVLVGAYGANYLKGGVLTGAGAIGDWL